MNRIDSFETDRLSAERLRQEHFEFVHRMHQDEAVMAKLGGTRSREKTSEYFKHNLAHWEKYGYGIWVLRDKATGSFVGRGGIRNTVVEDNREVEVAYGFMPDFWNKGLATEFVAKVVRIGLVDLGLSSLVSITASNNLASRRVMEKAGFSYERGVLFNDKRQVLYRLNAAQLKLQ